MPNPSISGPLLGLILVFAIVGPMFAGISLLVTRHPRTRYFWIFTLLCVIGSAWWLSTLVRPERVFQEVFDLAAASAVEDLEYEIDRRPNEGVLLFRFRARPETVRRLVGLRAMALEALPPIAELVPEGLETAGWWPPAWTSEAVTYHGVGTGAQYGHLDEWLLHDPGRGEVCYLMVGSR